MGSPSRRRAIYLTPDEIDLARRALTHIRDAMNAASGERISNSGDGRFACKIVRDRLTDLIVLFHQEAAGNGN